ncbi:GcrA cell cycle regulator [Bradyrhizobium yuanmingense]|nr:GcrA family cell cycle regulator [Bradyrhizobium yuanmingense]MVT49848.1 GcrA cell cycle regulator [Bradyrhizobium yuanmingense]
MTWSDDRIRQLEGLWRAGLSASQIAAELGNVTRNAVIGKVHKLGLPNRSSVSDYQGVAPMSQRLSLLELNESTCHWPVGDPSSPDFFFCGRKALPGLPYCAEHSKVIYTPAGERRKQKPK